jgi:hypothetical protein
MKYLIALLLSVSVAQAARLTESPQVFCYPDARLQLSEICLEAFTFDVPATNAVSGAIIFTMRQRFVGAHNIDTGERLRGWQTLVFTYYDTGLISYYRHVFVRGSRGYHLNFEETVYEFQ